MCNITLHRAARSDQDDDTNWTVNDILRQFGPAYLNKYRDRMSLDQIRALEALARCRLPEAGSVAYRCRECAALHHVPKSCGNRHCPGCQGEKAREWLAEQQARLLPCAYFLMTFTMPAEFRRFARSHPRECYRALFEAANQAMCELAKNPKHLGSNRLGMTGVLHTWGRDLNYHPHVHFIVPGGALSRDGKQWIASRVNFFLPVRALSILFRAKYKECLRNAGLLGQVRNEVWRRAWIVNCQAVGDGRDALRYLAPYVFRVAIGNHRIRRVVCHEDGTGTVTFLVKPSGQRRYRPMTVTAEEFIRRFLQHVLPRGFQKVRHYGFMHKRSKVRPRWLEMLVTVTLNMVYVLNVTCEIKPPKPQRRCPDCGGVLDCLGYRPPPRCIPTLDSS